MAGEPTLTLAGNITANPEQRGDTVTFTIAHNTRRRDRNGQTVDGDAVFMRCAAFGDLAQNIMRSCYKGMRVVATGYMKTNNWTDKTTGQQRSNLEMIVTDLGVSLRFGVTQFRRPAANSPTATATGRTITAADTSSRTTAISKAHTTTTSSRVTANRLPHRHRRNLQHPHSPQWIRGLRPRQPARIRTATAPTRNSKRFRH